jgi:Ser/Thr protein kinase RdoA (MazF antagonist)
MSKPPAKESPKPHLSPELLHFVQEAYGIKAIGEPVVFKSSRNLNVLITTADGRFVLRAYRAWITPERLAAIQTARKALGAHGVPSAQLQKTTSGATWTIHTDNLIELETYIENDANMDTWERLEVGLPILGHAHSILKKLTATEAGKQPIAANHIAPEAVLRLVDAAAERIKAVGATPESTKFITLAKSLADRLQKLEVPFRGKLPHQLVHGDFWDNNVMFHDGKVALVTDLDMMGERARVDDLALTLYYTTSSFDGDRLSPERIKRLRHLADLYDTGQDEPLSADERAALPLAIVRTPLFMLNYIAMMTSKQEMAGPIAGTLSDFEWGSKLLDNIEAWQQAFTAPNRPAAD